MQPGKGLVLNTRLAAHCTPGFRNLQGDCGPQRRPSGQDGVLEALNLPGYTSLLDARPRQVADQQFQ